jgi:cellobiose phosphorylase
MHYGHFDDPRREFVITDPLPPRPWINYLGNRRLCAFISQNAGGMLWHHEPQCRRVSRYHYIAPPQDRPGFYVYLRDRSTGTLWNPHFAPTCTALDEFQCHHAPGVTRFSAARNDIRADLTYVIPPADDVMLWHLSLRNEGDRLRELDAVSYLEFGLLEYMREVIGWTYLQHHTNFAYDPDLEAIRYDYHAFEAPFQPRMLFGSTAPVAGYECSREAFVGRTGTLREPQALSGGVELGGSELPIGGHGCGVLGTKVGLQPDEKTELTFVFSIGESWGQAGDLLRHYRTEAGAEEAVEAITTTWEERLSRLQVESDDPVLDRFVNTWNPYQSMITLDLCRSTSSDHVGLDGLRYRDSTQDAHAVANLDPDFAARRMRQVFSVQTEDGGGCFAFWPDNPQSPTDEPHRSDNNVWPVYTVKNLIAETGSLDLLEEEVPFRSGGKNASIYEHILLGLRHIWERRGPHGLPTLFHADWNDGLALWQDEEAESVMLGMQMVYALREFSELCERVGQDADARWCRDGADDLREILNSEAVWDGAWYRRLLLSNSKALGSAECAEGHIFLNPQSWAVICGVGELEERGRRAMDSAAERLDTECGLRIVAPPYTGIPEPEDPPLGSNPGVGENGSIFCHANTWAIIAEAILGNAERAFHYHRQLIPQVTARTAGEDHYAREPYVYVSSIVGPDSDRFGEGGISWLTGTSSWMYVAATHYLLGVRPTLDGLRIEPCLPRQVEQLTIHRRFRACHYEIEIHNEGRESIELEINGRPIDGTLVPVQDEARCRVLCRC